MLKLLLVSFISVVGAVAAESTPTPTPGSFLSLPTVDLDRVAESSAASPIRVGDTVRFQVHGASVNAFEVAEAERKSLFNQGLQIIPCSTPTELCVAVLRPGKLTLPSLPLLANGQAFARTNPVEIDIQSVIDSADPKAKEPAPLKPPLDLAFPLWALIALGVVTTALIGTAIWAWIRHRKKKGAAGFLKRTLPPDEQALRQLQELETEKYWLQGQTKKHYFTISELLKSYLAYRFKFPAEECTTSELLAIVRERPGLSPHETDLRTVFEQLDRVKFTDHVPERDEPLQLIQWARVFIHKTRGSATP